MGKKQEKATKKRRPLPLDLAISNTRIAVAEHIPGSENVEPDHLSRLQLPGFSVPATLHHVPRTSVPIFVWKTDACEKATGLNDHGWLTDLDSGIPTRESLLKATYTKRNA